MNPDEQQPPTAADVAREIRAQEAAEKTAKNKKAGQGCLITLVIIAIITLFIWLGSRDDASSTSPSPSEIITLPNGDTVDASLAIVLCRDHIRDQLLSPASAEFPGPFSDEYTRPSRVGNTWQNTMHVDSQNAFGALLPSSWFCEINGDTGLITAREQ